MSEDKIDLSNLPKHIAVIMDGNGRWAKQQGAKRIFGHHEGVKAVRETVETCVELGIEYLTLYTFSTENWTRPKIEVDGIMSLLVSTISKEVPDLHRNKVRLKCIGDLNQLPSKAKKEMEDAIEMTQHNTGLVLNLALSYSGKWDILQAAKKIAEEYKSENIKLEDINERLFNSKLSTNPDPDVDLLIRTGGDHRISNYLLWQSAYAELLFLDDIFWPDFRKVHMIKAIVIYQQRERRFGKTGDQVKERV